MKLKKKELNALPEVVKLAFWNLTHDIGAMLDVSSIRTRMKEYLKEL